MLPPIRFYFLKSKHWQWKFQFVFVKRLLWKDKFNSPRHEVSPKLSIAFGYWTLCWERGTDREWEQWLWVNKYNKGNYQKAKDSWGWKDLWTGKSTWKDYKFLKK